MEKLETNMAEVWKDIKGYEGFIKLVIWVV